MRIVFCWDDGAMEDQKLFEYHEKYKIPGMFFVPTRNREGRDVLTPKMIMNAESKYIQYGGHTENHTYLTDIPISEVEEEVVSNQKYLENILGHKIEHFCMPGGKYNSDILRIVKKHFRTIRTADTMNFSRANDSLIIPTFHFYHRGRKSLIGNALRQRSYSQIVHIFMHLNQDYFNEMKSLIDDSGTSENDLIIWGHSWEVEQYQLWKELDSLMQYVVNNYSKQIVSYDELTRFL